MWAGRALGWLAGWLTGWLTDRLAGPTGGLTPNLGGVAVKLAQVEPVAARGAAHRQEGELDLEGYGAGRSRGKTSVK